MQALKIDQGRLRISRYIALMIVFKMRDLSHFPVLPHRLKSTHKYSFDTLFT